jgi:type IV fimbrial biogenesis protein FimT
MLRVATPQPRARGLTLIELIVGVAIVAFIMAMAMPSLSGYLHNTKLRATAQSFASGASAARALAIQRNATVEFVIASAGVTASNVGSVTLARTGQNWAVRVPPVAPATAYEYIEGHTVQDGRSQNVEVAASATSVSFNGLGMASGAMTVDFTNTQGGPCAVDEGPMRCMQLRVSGGGQVRLCDTQAGSADSRRC